MIIDMISTLILGVVSSWLFFTWCILVKNGDYDTEEGKFIIKFIVSLTMLGISIALFYAMCIMATEYKESKTASIIGCIVGVVFGGAFAFAQDYYRKKNN